MFVLNHIRSLGHKKGLLLLQHISEFTPRKDYLVVKTPSNKKYISANFVLFRDPPTSESFSRWPEIFEKEFKNDPGIKHIKFEWDNSERNDSIISEFNKLGFTLEEYETLVLDELKTPKALRSALEIKEIDYIKDWSKVVSQQMLFRPPTLSEEYYTEFSQNLMNAYSSLIKNGLCKWFGAYINGTLVGSLGVLWSSEIAGFQRVVVDNKHRNQGVCTNLIHWTSNWVQTTLNVNKVVIWAEKDSTSSKIYRTCGFSFAEELLALNKYPDL